MTDRFRAPAGLVHEVEQFLYFEADLLDDRKFDAWLALFADDLRYWMPLARNVSFRDPGSEYSREQEQIAWMDEGKVTLGQRVRQLQTGIHWAEEPHSRMSHVVTNVRIIAVDEASGEVTARSRFLVYRNRLDDEQDFLIGKRQDTLRPDGGSWLIRRREIYLDQNVLLAKNLTTFF